MPPIDWLALFQTTEHPAFPAWLDRGLVGPKTPAAPPPADDDGGAVDGTSAPLDRDVEQPAKTPKTAKTSAASPHDAGFGGFDSFDAGLQKAVQAANRLGVRFRRIGADIDIEGELPDDLRAVFTDKAEQLYEYLDAAHDDQAAIDLLAQLRVTANLVTDSAAADAAMRALDGVGILGLDFETGPPDAWPEPVKINSTGTVAVHQPKPSKAGLDPYASVIQTAQLYGGRDAYMFQGAGLRHLLESAWFREQRYAVHNAGFEYKFAKHRGIELQQVECSLQAVGLLHGIEEHSRDLAAAAKTVLNLEVPKALQTSFWSAPRLSSAQISYGAVDSIIAYRLWQKLAPELRRRRLWGYELQRDAIPAVADMELRGMGFAKERHARLVAEWQTEVAELEQQILELTGQPPPKRGDEERAWIASVAGDLLPTWPRTKKKNLLQTTAADYARLEDVPAAEPILELRAKKTLLANFGDKIADLVNPITGRIHGGFKISGAKTGRFSSNSPNMQNQPGQGKAPAYKSVFAAAPSYVLLSGDWKQVELRAIAHVAGCPVMTAVFENGGDPHTETALAVVGKRREEVSAEELALLRTRAEAVNFGTVYGVTGKGLAELAWKNYRIKMTAEEGDRMVARFFATHPRIKQWMDWSFAEAARLGHIRIGVGRIIEARWEKDRELSRQQAANAPIQGICADLILRAIKLTFERLRAAGVDGGLIACIHDELLLEVAEADAARARQILEETMTEAFSLTFPGAPTTGGVVDLKIGPSWGELQEVES
jgi:DNA polymerase I-like protein with 3'-5' exonuclease and polymerase domains